VDVTDVVDHGSTAPNCANILLDAGATISAKDEEYRSTPLGLHGMICQTLPDMVELLIGRGATLNLADDEPWATAGVGHQERPCAHRGDSAECRRSSLKASGAPGSRPR
jgi:hypothetical protein